MAVSRKERREKLKRKETTLNPEREKENVIGDCLGVFDWPSDLHLSGEMLCTDERREEDQNQLADAPAQRGVETSRAHYGVWLYAEFVIAPL